MEPPSVDLACHQGLFDFPDEFSDLNIARAYLGAVENRPAAPHAIRLCQHLQTASSAFIARVEDKAVRLHYRSRPDIITSGPE